MSDDEKGFIVASQATIARMEELNGMDLPDLWKIFLDTSDMSAAIPELMDDNPVYPVAVVIFVKMLHGLRALTTHTDELAKRMPEEIAGKIMETLIEKAFDEMNETCSSLFKSLMVSSYLMGKRVAMGEFFNSLPVASEQES